LVFTSTYFGNTHYELSLGTVENTTSFCAPTGTLDGFQVGQTLNVKLLATDYRHAVPWLCPYKAADWKVTVIR
jgi:hypothetical protein